MSLLRNSLPEQAPAWQNHDASDTHQPCLDNRRQAEETLSRPHGSRSSRREEAHLPTGHDLFAEIKEFARLGKKFNVELGIKVHQLRQTIPHGDWMQKWDPATEPPFRIGKAEDLDQIGERLGQLNSSDRTNLPSALSSLRVLAELASELLLRLIWDKEIRPGLKYLDAVALVAKYKPEFKPPGAAKFKMGTWLARQERQFALAEKHAKGPDRAIAIKALREAADRLERGSA
jgi:hypothetical protein